MTMDDIATGKIDHKIYIAGRPKPGRSEKYILLEEPEKPVQVHWSGRLVPHLIRNCPNCCGKDDVKAMWYIGACASGANEFVILELNAKCHQTAERFSRYLGATGIHLDLPAPSRFTGLIVHISRTDFAFSPRVLRCEQRCSKDRIPVWPYRTREELARIWGIPIRPRIYREKPA